VGKGDDFGGNEMLATPGMLKKSIVNKWVFPKIGGFPPKSSILIGFSIINHPFWGIPIFGKNNGDRELSSTGRFSTINNLHFGLLHCLYR